MKISPAARPLRVLAAMSGGVDSAVAAARAAQAGHDVTGIHLALSSNPQSYRTGARGCCTLEDSRDARRAADVIGIPFYVWDMAERFDRDVVQDFVAEYAAGRTPNPCLRCNEKIKFEAVLDRAVALGFDAVCTGHHARLVDGVLHRSPDAGKDQSYVLAVLRPDQLERAMFPLGDSTKEEVRAEARERGLQVADKPDSHDVCFIADGDTRGFLADRLGTEPGPIVDAEGEVLGSHDGAYAFTVGQRKGLGLGRAPDGRPRYVLSIEPVNNTVTVGTADDLEVTVIEAERPVWSGIAPPEGPLDCLVQLRAHGDPLPATVEPLATAPKRRADTGQTDAPRADTPRADTPQTATAQTDTPQTATAQAGAGIRITLAVPARGVAAGQAAVLYEGDRVLGSATISGTGAPAEQAPEVRLA